MRTTETNLRRAVSDVKIPLWPSAESRTQQKVNALWAPRIGEDGAREVVRASIDVGRFLFLIGTWLVLVIFFQVVHSDLAVAISCLLWLPILYLGYGIIRSTRRIQRAAGAHLGLTYDEYRVMPVTYDLFDRWIASRGDPGWPRRFRRA